MPANQLFTDWLTGDIITAARLNQMKNDLAALGANNDFDGFQRVRRIDTPSAGGAVSFIVADALNRSRWAWGVTGAETGSSNTGSNFVVWRYNDSGTLISEALTINRADGTIRHAGINRMWHAGNQLLTAITGGWTGSLANGQAAFDTVSVPGAAIGDGVVVANPFWISNTSGLFIRVDAAVTAAGVVTIGIYNQSGSTINFTGIGTRVWVLKN